MHGWNLHLVYCAAASRRRLPRNVPQMQSRCFCKCSPKRRTFYHSTRQAGYGAANVAQPSGLRRTWMCATVFKCTLATGRAVTLTAGTAQQVLHCCALQSGMTRRTLFAAWQRSARKCRSQAALLHTPDRQDYTTRSWWPCSGRQFSPGVFAICSTAEHFATRLHRSRTQEHASQGCYQSCLPGQGSPVNTVQR